MRRIMARFKSSCILIGNPPQTLTGHAATVSGHVKQTTIDKEELIRVHNLQTTEINK